MQLSGAFGLAILGTLATDRTKQAVADGTAQIPAFVEGFQFACVIAAVIVTTGIAWMLLAAREPKGAEEQAAEVVAEGA